MKSAWDWPLARRSVNQAGIITFAAGLVNGFVAGSGILPTISLIAIGMLLIISSILRRVDKMNDVVIAALVGAIPLIILMIIGLYYNR